MADRGLLKASLAICCYNLVLNYFFVVEQNLNNTAVGAKGWFLSIRLAAVVTGYK